MRALLILLLMPFTLHAQDLRQERVLFCDTPAQVGRVFALVENGDTVPFAVLKVNAVENKACAFAGIIFYKSDKVVAIFKSAKTMIFVYQIAVIGLVDGMGHTLGVQPISQFSPFLEGQAN
jgi:hypothetical protein